MLRKFICTVISICCLSIISVVSVNAAYQGVDVSEWQGYIDYRDVRRDGIDIVYIKTSQGTNITDPYFRTNYDNAKRYGLKVGFYHFLTARSTEEAREEAEYFSSVISGTKPDCRLAMDFEQLGGLTRREVNDISFAFLERVEELTKKEMIIYSDLSNARDVFSRELARKYPLWIAEYGIAKPSDTGSWDNWIGHQYTDMGRVRGIRGSVDRDNFKDEILLSSKERIKTRENTTNKIVRYKVRKGDTLSGIARKHRTTVHQIAGLNNIRNKDLIFIEDELIIDITRDIDEIQKTIHDSRHFIYTIKRGDTLNKIAKEFDVSVNRIIRLNDIKNRNLIYAGERLRINR
ncbi:MAG: LysM peptidoglycan-binding domain-containing protein [Clostridia bacterium]|nr:LysM peptidoglycan-binding domain-containing protein [Clostridia bacterium]